ncbi:MAG: protein kinase [Defluviitaleaceae bacterium]|nr:protein kinase [Defluviitaleaceae bacterium]
MFYAIPEGTKLTSKHKIKYAVIKFIASGGQGEVYEIEDKGTGVRYALKWYYKRSATPYQLKLIERLIERGSPDHRFLWPIDIVAREGSFGYVMRLRPPYYKSVVDLMKRRANPSFGSLCLAAINLADGYQNLHSHGLCYRDISFGNLFFNPDDGDVLICDNDNVTINRESESGAIGTPRFIAPEIVTGKKGLSTETDLYSMAVLLFYMFMLHHPLEGRMEAEIKCFDAKAMEKIYGREPVFIWDPDDASNRPVPGYQDNAIIFWKIYPPFIREMFTRSFTRGLRDCSRRVVEKEWKDAFATLRDSIMFCQDCGKENFYESVSPCWGCGRKIAPPPRLELGKRTVMLNRGAKLHSHHVYGDYDYARTIGKVVRHPTLNNKWGLENECGENWTITKPSGERAVIEPGRTVPFIIGVKINFGPIEGVIK